YAWETCANELTQLLNVIFGNISIQTGVKVLDIDLPEIASQVFPGPAFGIQGLRKIHNAYDRPLICTALKPMGLSASDLADMAYEMALGGVDIIKDDHGLSNQIFAPYEERVQRCCEAVIKANSITGGNTAYYPNITAPGHQLVKRASFAARAGAGGLLYAPGLSGWDTINWLRTEGIKLPIMAHPTFFGTYVLHPDIGFTHKILYGKLTRLCGADSSVFPNYGGRFSFTQDECRSIKEGCQEDFSKFRSIFPAPGGGMNLNRIQELVSFYGNNVILLVGGDLHRGESISATSRQFRDTTALAVTKL
ncbi:MAG: hypothetical protein JXA25_07805, partial [Anaerolineales bacterium]|nr:hypothetical protein [Anaerolineales bacterium]